MISNEPPESKEPEGPTTLKFPCKACGAEMSFDIGSGSLKCGYCDYEEKIPDSADQVVEHEFEGYSEAGQPTGYGTEMKHLDCPNCGAHWSVEPQVTSASCPFCGSSQVEARADDAISFRGVVRSMEDRFESGGATRHEYMDLR